MTPLSRGIISSGKLDEGGPSFFATSVADFNGTNQVLTYPNGICAGEATISIECFVEFDSIGTQVIYQETKTSSLSSRLQFYMGSGGEVVLGLRDADGGSFLGATTNATLSTGVMYHLLGVLESSTNTFKIYIDTVSQSFSSVSPSFGAVMAGAYFLPSNIGSVATNIQNLNGRLSFLNIYNTDKSSVISDLYNGGDATCYASRTPTMKAGEIFSVELANWSGHTGVELVEHVGAVTITNNNSTPFTGTGPTVEC